VRFHDAQHQGLWRPLTRLLLGNRVAETAQEVGTGGGAVSQDLTGALSGPRRHGTPVWVVSLSGPKADENHRLAAIANARGALLGVLAPVVIAIGAVAALVENC